MKNKSVVIFSVAMIIAASVLGAFFYLSRQGQHTISVTGSASQNFICDTVKWTVTMRESVGRDELALGYRLLEEKTQKLLREFTSNGVSPDEITIKPINAYKDYGQQGFQGYNLEQTVYLISTEIDKVEGWALHPVKLVDQGITIENSTLEYFYSKLDDLKKDLLANATANAEERALNMLANTDLQLGKVLSMRSGVFQITEPLSTMVSSSGIYDTSTREKQISVTAHVTYAIK